MDFAGNDIQSTTATIETLNVSNFEVESLSATTANITSLTATSANIGSLTVSSVSDGVHHNTLPSNDGRIITTNELPPIYPNIQNTWLNTQTFNSTPVLMSNAISSSSASYLLSDWAKKTDIPDVSHMVQDNVNSSISAVMDFKIAPNIPTFSHGTASISTPSVSGMIALTSQLPDMSHVVLNNVPGNIDAVLSFNVNPKIGAISNSGYLITVPSVQSGTIALLSDVPSTAGLASLSSANSWPLLQSFSSANISSLAATNGVITSLNAATLYSTTSSLTSLTCTNASVSTMSCGSLNSTSANITSATVGNLTCSGTISAINIPAGIVDLASEQVITGKKVFTNSLGGCYITKMVATEAGISNATIGSITSVVGSSLQLLDNTSVPQLTISTAGMLGTNFTCGSILSTTANCEALTCSGAMYVHSSSSLYSGTSAISWPTSAGKFALVGDIPDNSHYARDNTTNSFTSVQTFSSTPIFQTGVIGGSGSTTYTLSALAKTSDLAPYALISSVAALSSANSFTTLNSFSSLTCTSGTMSSLNCGNLSITPSSTSDIKCRTFSYQFPDISDTLAVESQIPSMVDVVYDNQTSSISATHEFKQNPKITAITSPSNYTLTIPNSANATLATTAQIPTDICTLTTPQTISAVKTFTANPIISAIQSGTSSLIVPSASNGTLARIDQLPSSLNYVDLTTAQTVGGQKTFSALAQFSNIIASSMTCGSIVSTGASVIGNITMSYNTSSTTSDFKCRTYSYGLPPASGQIALTSDLSPYAALSSSCLFTDPTDATSASVGSLKSNGGIACLGKVYAHDNIISEGSFYGSSFIGGGTTSMFSYGTLHPTTIACPYPGQSSTYTIPDVGATANFLMTQGDQTKTGILTMSSPTISDSKITAGTTSITLTSLALSSSVAALSSANLFSNTTDVSGNPSYLATTNKFSGGCYIAKSLQVGYSTKFTVRKTGCASSSTTYLRFGNDATVLACGATVLVSSTGSSNTYDFYSQLLHLSFGRGNSSPSTIGYCTTVSTNGHGTNYGTWSYNAYDSSGITFKCVWPNAGTYELTCDVEVNCHFTDSANPMTISLI